MQYKRVYSKVRLNGNKQKYGVTDTIIKRITLINIYLRLPYNMTAVFVLIQLNLQGGPGRV